MKLRRALLVPVQLVPPIHDRSTFRRLSLRVTLWSQAAIVGTALAAWLGSAPGLLQAQTLLGSEFQVNVFTLGSQSYPAVGRGSNGHFVVAWTADSMEGIGRTVVARSFASDGTPASGEVIIHSFPNADPSQPGVTVDASGNAWITWGSQGDGDGDGVVARRMSSAGSLLTGEIQVNTLTVGNQRRPKISGQSDGDFVISWQDDTTGNYEIRQRRFLGDGTPIGSEVLVNTTTTNDQTAPAVALNEAGRFVVAWESFGQDFSGNSIQARLQSSPSPEVQINSFTSGDQELPAAAIDSSDNAVIVWQSSGQDGDSTSTHARRLLSSGMPSGPEIRVNTATLGMQGHPAAALSATGIVSIVFDADSVDGDASAVQLREYDSSLNPLAAPLRVNSYTQMAQSGPAIASDGGGGLVIVWQSDFQDGSALGIFGRRVESGVTTTTTTTSSTATSTSTSTTTSSSTTTTTLPPLPPPEVLLLTNATSYSARDLFQIDVCIDDHGTHFDLYVGALFPNHFTFLTFSGRNTVYPFNTVGPFQNDLFAGIYCLNVAQFNLPPAPFGPYLLCAWLVTPENDPTHFANIAALDCHTVVIGP